MSWQSNVRSEYENTNERDIKNMHSISSLCWLRQAPALGSEFLGGRCEWSANKHLSIKFWMGIGMKYQ